MLPVLSGVLLVAAPPRYQLPMSVSRPFCVSIEALGPTLETEDRKEPKYEYRSIYEMLSKYSAEELKKACVVGRDWLLSAYSVTQMEVLGYLFHSR
jgi:hypothetical protein